MNLQGEIVVTGAAGFVGRALVLHLAGLGLPVRAAVRRPAEPWPAGVAEIALGDIDALPDWHAALAGAHAVVHCAGRAHVLCDTADQPLTAFRRVNVDATLHLARQSNAAGVRRFVFVSSIGVNGAETWGTPFRASDRPAPHSPYAQSKHEAETGLLALAAGGPMQVVIVRPPMVYGPGAPGNFARLLHAVHRGLPLPLGAVHNRRSLVALGNLVDLLHRCVDHPAAAGGTWLVSDDEDVSTTELLRRVAHAAGRPARLLPLHGGALRVLTRLAGRAELGQRLLGSLQLDIAATRSALQWTPPFTMAQALASIVQASAGPRP